MRAPWRLPLLDRIWRTRGAVPLPPSLTPVEAFDRLTPLFDPAESRIDRESASLAWRKPNPAAQDRLATFSSGILRLAERDGRPVLAYDAGSPALALVFAAPLLFLALGGANVGLGQIEAAMAEGSRSGEGATAGEEKEEEEEANDGEEQEAKGREDPAPLHWFDTMLGVPPGEPSYDKEEGDKGAQEDMHSPYNAFGIAALFALLYLFGRWHEPRKLRRVLHQAIEGEATGAGRPLKAAWRSP